MTKKKRLELINEAKELGMQSITIDGVKYDLRQNNDIVKELTIPSDKETEELVKKLIKNPLDDLTEEEILYYATPYYDELQEKKKLIEQQRNDKESIQ